MTSEIETFLLEKLKEAIHTQSTNDNKKLLNLQTLLQPNAGTTPAVDELKRREILYLLNNLLSQRRIITEQHGFYSPEVVHSDCKLRQNLQDIEKDLKGKEGSGAAGEALRGNTSNNGGSIVSAVENYRWSSREIDLTKVRGFDDKESFLERLLVKKESKEIAIVGVLGVGKTTLCQMIFNNKKVKQYFLPRIWVCMSRQIHEDANNDIEMVKRILRCLGIQEEIIKASAGDDPNHALENLMYALKLQLTGKKYLIVVDDVWNSESKLDQFACKLPKGHGGTVIITTRNEETAEKMVGEKNVHILLPLKDRKSCWEIFMDAVEKDGKKYPDNLLELKNNILDKCAGLPLSAKMMGQIMNQNLPNKPR